MTAEDRNRWLARIFAVAVRAFPFRGEFAVRRSLVSAVRREPDDLPWLRYLADRHADHHRQGSGPHADRAGI